MASDAISRRSLTFGRTLLRSLEVDTRASLLGGAALATGAFSFFSAFVRDPFIGSAIATSSSLASVALLAASTHELRRASYYRARFERDVLQVSHLDTLAPLPVNAVGTVGKQSELPEKTRKRIFDWWASEYGADQGGRAQARAARIESLYYGTWSRRAWAGLLFALFVFLAYASRSIVTDRFSEILMLNSSDSRADFVAASSALIACSVAVLQPAIQNLRHARDRTNLLRRVGATAVDPGEPSEVEDAFYQLQMEFLREGRTKVPNWFYALAKPVIRRRYRSRFDVGQG